MHATERRESVPQIFVPDPEPLAGEIAKTLFRGLWTLLVWDLRVLARMALSSVRDAR
jgi:hypothetical protein